MMATRVNSIASKAAPYLLMAAVSSLVTSWAFKTPELNKKAETLQVVEQKTLPAMAGSLAKVQTDLKQSNCDKTRYVEAGIKGVLADNDPKLAGPEWDDLRACPKVAPVKPLAVSKLIPVVKE